MTTTGILVVKHWNVEYIAGQSAVVMTFKSTSGLDGSTVPFMESVSSATIYSMLKSDFL